MEVSQKRCEAIPGMEGWRIGPTTEIRTTCLPDVCIDFGFTEAIESR